MSTARLRRNCHQTNDNMYFLISILKIIAEINTIILKQTLNIILKSIKDYKMIYINIIDFDETHWSFSDLVNNINFYLTLIFLLFCCISLSTFLFIIKMALFQKK